MAALSADPLCAKLLSGCYLSLSSCASLVISMASSIMSLGSLESALARAGAREGGAPALVSSTRGAGGTGLRCTFKCCRSEEIRSIRTLLWLAWLVAAAWSLQAFEGTGSGLISYKKENELD